MKFLHRLAYLLKEIPQMIRRLFTGSAIAGILLLAFTGSVAAHDATSDCESITLTNAAQWTADIKRTDVEPDLLVWDDVAGVGTFAVRAGVYRIAWNDGFVYGEIVVQPCEQPSPTPTPDPTPTTPVNPCLTEPVAVVPGCVSPTPTPAATPTPQPSATPSATPEPSDPVETLPPPEITPPPTDMATVDVLEPGPIGLMAALALVLTAAGSVWLAMRRAR